MPIGVEIEVPCLPMPNWDSCPWWHAGRKNRRCLPLELEALANHKPDRGQPEGIVRWPGMPFQDQPVGATTDSWVLIWLGSDKVQASTNSRYLPSGACFLRWKSQNWPYAHMNRLRTDRSSLRVATVQFESSPGDKEANFRKIE